MRKLCFVLLLSSVAPILQAQTPLDSSAKNISFTGRNELLFGINPNAAFPILPTGILYRRNYEKFSLRAHIGGGYSASGGPHTSYERRSYRISPSLGIQRNHTLGKGFQLYWGGDVFYSLSEQWSSNNSGYDSHHTMNAVGLAPFVGLRYYHKRLILGIETLGSFSYVSKQGSVYDPNPLAGPQEGPNNGSFFDFNRGANIRLMIGYRFR